MEFKTKMGQYAESFGLEEKSIKGMGKEYLDTVMQAAFTGIGKRGIASRNQGSTNMINNGMQFSGAHEVKMPAQIAGGMLEEASNVQRDVYAQDEQYKMNMQNMFMGVLQHEDSMDLARQQMDAQRGDLFDVITRVGSILTAI